jgi:hypothetical protein
MVHPDVAEADLLLELDLQVALQRGDLSILVEAGELRVIYIRIADENVGVIGLNVSHRASFLRRQSGRIELRRVSPINAWFQVGGRESM